MPLKEESWENVSLPMKCDPINELNFLWLFPVSNKILK